jgi:hypothetical protein
MRVVPCPLLSMSAVKIGYLLASGILRIHLLPFASIKSISKERSPIWPYSGLDITTKDRAWLNDAVFIPDPYLPRSASFRDVRGFLVASLKEVASSPDTQSIPQPSSVMLKIGAPSNRILTKCCLSRPK